MQSTKPVKIQRKRKETRMGCEESAEATHNYNHNVRHELTKCKAYVRIRTGKEKKKNTEEIFA